MSLDKAIKYKKEKRKPYKGGKSISSGCRNHGWCSWCRGNRLHSSRKRLVRVTMECLNCGSEVKQHLMPFCDEDCETDYWCRVEDGAYLESIGNDEDVPL